mgnify:CR=1 FL=1
MCIKNSNFAGDMRKIIFFIVCIFGAATALGQTHSSADKLFQSGDYAGASQAYAALLKSYPTNALYLYRYARCAQEMGNDTTAIQYFDKAGDRYKLKYFYLGKSYLRLWRAEEAIEAYNTYLNTLKEPNEREAYILKRIAEAEKLQRYLRRVEKLQVIDSIEVALDSMLQVCTLSAEAGTLTWDSVGSTIYTNQRGDRQIKTTLADSTRILTTTHRLLDEWTQPDTLPHNINFTQDQRSPYILNDGVTLYFAANDSNGLGGLDIYVSRYNMATENFTTPENLGMPYNSPANEYLFVLDEMHQIGYLATDRFATEGRVHVYSFAISEQKEYWRNIASVEDYFHTNMDFLKPEVRNYFFKQYPDIYSKVEDLPPAKYNVGSAVKNSLISSGCIVNGEVENSVVFKKVYIGNNCVIKNSIIMNDVYIGDNTYIENCIVESRDTIQADSCYVGEGEIKIVVEKNARYVI